MIVKDVNGIVAREIIPGVSKVQVESENQYPHCNTVVKPLGWGEVSLREDQFSGDVYTFISSPKGKIISFGEDTIEEKNQIETNIHNNGKNYLQQNTANLPVYLLEDESESNDSE